MIIHALCTCRKPALPALFTSMVIFNDSWYIPQCNSYPIWQCCGHEHPVCGVEPIYSTQLIFITHSYTERYGVSSPQYCDSLTAKRWQICGYGSLLETMAVDRSLRFSWLVAACALASAALVQGKPSLKSESPCTA